MINIKQEINNINLRKKLEIITENSEISLPQHIDLVCKLKNEYNHSITIEEEAILEQVKTWKYSCFQYAFNLIEPSQEVIKIAKSDSGHFIGSEFVLYLTKNTLDEVKNRKLCEGDLVIYSDSLKIQHAGKIKDVFVISKWGEWPIWKHKLYEVPQSYGDNVNVYKPISSIEANEAFMEYSKTILPE
jgi:hypothetical protein